MYFSVCGDFANSLKFAATYFQHPLRGHDSSPVRSVVGSGLWQPLDILCTNLLTTRNSAIPLGKKNKTNPTKQNCRHGQQLATKQTEQTITIKKDTLSSSAYPLSNPPPLFLLDFSLSLSYLSRTGKNEGPRSPIINRIPASVRLPLRERARLRVSSGWLESRPPQKGTFHFSQCKHIRKNKNSHEQSR